MSEKNEYLRYMLTNDKQDDAEILRQLHLLYAQLNQILRMFYFVQYMLSGSFLNVLYVVFVLLSMDRVQKIYF